MNKRTRGEYEEENLSVSGDNKEPNEESVEEENDSEDSESDTSGDMQEQILETERQVIKMASGNYPVKDVSVTEEKDFIAKLRKLCDDPNILPNTIIFDKDHDIIEEIMRQNRVLAQEEREKYEFINKFESKKYTKKYPTVN